MKSIGKKRLLLLIAAVTLVLNIYADEANSKKQKTCTTHTAHKGLHQKIMNRSVVGKLWIYTSYAVGGESYVLLSHAKGNAYGPTFILNKEANAQPKTAARIQAENYTIYTMHVTSFAVPPYAKGSPVGYKWVAMDNIFNVIQHAAASDDDDGVSVEARDNSLIVLDKKFVQALVNDFRKGEAGVIFSHVDLTRPSENPDVTGYAG